MRNFLLPLLLLVAAVAPARAAVVVNLYEAAAPVEDHSEQQLARGTREALARVLVKVSGSEAILAEDEARAALSRASDYLQQFQYRRVDEDTLEVVVSFDRELVTDTVMRTGAPLWTANRPPVLVWLVADTPIGRTLGAQDFQQELHQALREGFDRRGVPLKFPLYDLQDSMALTATELWQLQTLSIYRATARYEVADVLVGRLSQTSDGSWIGEWMYLWEGGSAETSFYGESLDTLADGGVAMVAERMAARYAVATDIAGSVGLLIRVDGLQDFGDYRNLVRYLESVELIESVYPETIEPGSVVFRLRAGASAERLQPVLGLNRKLQLLDAAPPLRTGILADLEYRWNP